ncbi:MAG: hypothetical protein GX929_08190 [Clostridiales bacterium]|nr:hypothetical protein [Clostridiales bacterium]
MSVLDRFSLLSKYPEERDFDVIEDLKQAIYDLSLDQAVGELCPSKKQADYFLEILENPLRDVRNVRFRQDILRDILQNPQLLSDLKGLFRHYDTIGADWKEMRANVYSFGIGVSQRALLEFTFSQLQVTAKFAKMIIGYYFSLSEILQAYDLSSEGLQSIKTYCADMIANASLGEIVDIASHFLHYTPDHYEFSVRVSVDDGFRARVCDLCDALDLTVKPKGNLLKRYFDSRKAAADAPAETKVRDELPEDADFLLNEAIYRMYTVLTELTNHVYELFFGLSRELQFYDAAVLYCAKIQQHQMTACMPTVVDASHDVFHAKGLYDFLLLSEGLMGDQIVCNDVDMRADCDGILIRGNNSSGKTVYLRSLGISQIFAQAGLPVCAKIARISIRDGVFTHFSSAERDFKFGDTAGRFEGEVQCISRIMDRLRPHALVLLNETFQTTAYAEGTVAIFDILSILPRTRAKFVFVTHLTHLYDLCDPERVQLMQSASEGPERYHIRPLQI